MVLLAAILALPVGGSSGCQAGYVLRQGCRQLALQSKRVPLDSPELKDRLPAESLEKLRWIPVLLEFCRTELSLDPGSSYQTYLDTEGEPVGYAVTAAHPLALVPYQWHFPFAGTVPYKGYFEEEDATHEAKRLEDESFDTAVMPIGAFSTLGWFQDPVLSTMLEGRLLGLVDIIIHETTHRTLYFPGRAAFNESLATHMAREGTARFVSAHQELRDLLPEHLARRSALREREQLFLRLRDDLDRLYRSEEAPADKRARKAEVFATASAAYRKLGFDPEGAGIPKSNAFVLSVAYYHEFSTLLARLQEKQGGNPSDLMAYLKELPKTEDPVSAIRKELATQLK